MKFVTLLALILLSNHLMAAGQITEINDPHEIYVDIYDESKLKVEDRILVVSRKSNKAIAFGKVKKIDHDKSPDEAIIEIDEVIDNSIIVEKDFIYPVSYQLMKEKNIPGFTSLTLQGDNDIPAKYKELVYFGVFTSEGHSLDAQEFLISPFQIQYGVTNDFGIKVVNALWLDGYLNGGIKYRVMRNKYARMTINSLGAYKVQSQDYIWQTGGVITLPTNAKFNNHLMLTLTHDPQFSEAHATKGLNLFQDSDIRSITEYITDDWNRVLYGPTYNVELQTFGGTVSHMWIWETFHMSLGIATRDLSNLRFGKTGYYYVYDLFWRF